LSHISSPLLLPLWYSWWVGEVPQRSPGTFTLEIWATAHLPAPVCSQTFLFQASPPQQWAPSLFAFAYYLYFEWEEKCIFPRNIHFYNHLVQGLKAVRAVMHCIKLTYFPEMVITPLLWDSEYTFFEVWMRHWHWSLTLNDHY
jgi:hypothetical protein